MRQGLIFSEYPRPIEWGDKRHVPLNVEPETIAGEDGKAARAYRCDLVENVEQPLTVETIVKAAIRSEFGEETSPKMAMTLALRQADPETERFRKFVNDVTEAARAAGYQ